MAHADRERYSTALITLHWLTLLLVALAYAFVELRELFQRGTPERAFMRQAHFSLGLSVLGVTLLRVWARWQSGTPPIHPPLPRSQQFAARITHGLLYALLLGMPLAGWLLLSLRGDPVPFFGFELPALVAENEALAKRLRGWHGDAGRIGYGLIALHALAAIHHHRVRRDNTLLRLLPQR